MAQYFYFSGSLLTAPVGQTAGVFRVRDDGVVERVNAPGDFDLRRLVAVTSQNNDDQIFIAASTIADGVSVLARLDDSGALTALTGEDTSVSTAIAIGDDIVFRGTHQGVNAIWKLEADGDIIQLAAGLAPGSVFKFFDGAIFIDGVSDLNSPDGQAHAAIFKITLDGDVTRMTELRAFGVPLSSNSVADIVEVDADPVKAFVVGDKLLFSYATVVAIGVTPERIVLTDSITGAGVVERVGQGKIAHPGLAANTNDQTVYLQAKVLNASGFTLAEYDPATGLAGAPDTFLSSFQFLGVVSGKALLRVRQSGLPFFSTPDDNFQPIFGEDGSVFDPFGFRSISTSNQFVEVDGKLFFTATTSATGQELFKIENNIVSLAADIVPGPLGSSINSFIGLFDTGAAGGVRVGAIAPTEGPDIIVGTVANDTVFGLGGDDQIDGLEGEDVLIGGAGDDVLIGGAGNFRDKLVGGAGDDLLQGGDGPDRLFGNSGNDDLQGGAGNDQLVGQSGDDALDGGAGRDKLVGGVGKDALNGGAGSDRLYGNSGDDVINGGDGDDVIVGQSGNDDLTGGAGGDVFLITSGNGDDVIQDFDASVLSDDLVDVTRAGFASSAAAFAALTTNTDGDAVLAFVGGSVTFKGLAPSALGAHNFFTTGDANIGGPGNDQLQGNANNNRMFGHGGNDRVFSEGGIDALYGGGGNDFLAAGTGNDLIRAGDGNDKAFGNSGNDRIIGGAGDDALFGQSGNDLLGGGNGNDALSGSFGEDRLFGNTGDDVLDGGVGDDQMDGGFGDDTLTGGDGRDQFRFRDGSGHDVIQDFDGGLGLGDVIVLSHSSFSGTDGFAEILALTTNNSLGALIQVSATETINLVGVLSTDLAADDFLIEIS